MNQLTKAAKTLAAKYNSTSLILRIAIGLVVGSVLALICPGAAWIEEFGNLFVGALKGVAPVLVFVIVASALAQGSSKLDRRFGTVVWLYMLMSAAPQADYYLVLGALVNPNGQPSAALAARCDTAIAVLNVNPGSQAILCGGQGGDEPRTEAAAMQDYMIAHGADAERLILENKSSTTIQNIANAKKLLPEGAAVAVITNDYHLARARRLLAHAGLGDAGVPAKTPYPGQWMAVRCREYCSIMGLIFTGRW